MKPLPVDPLLKLRHQLSALFGCNTLGFLEEATFEHSRSTGRIKHFFVDGKLAGTCRTDGGIALTIHGAQLLLRYQEFATGHSVTANSEAVPFVSEGRSLFCRHVDRCGPAIAIGSEVAVLDPGNSLIAVGVALLHARNMKSFRKGVAVRVRQGLRSREEPTADKE